MKAGTGLEKNEAENPDHHDLLPSDIEAGGVYFRTMRRLCTWMCRGYFRIEFEGFENVPMTGPFIVAPNHQSYFDPFWVSIPFKYPLRYMTWDRFVYMPVVGHFIRTLGAFPVKLDKGDRAALRQALSHLKEGGTLMIFPEGGRSRNGRLMPFKPGVIRLAMGANAPIIPVSIIGGYAAFNPHHWFPRPRKVIVRYHPPFVIPKPDQDTEIKDFLGQQATRLQRVIEATLDGL